MARRPFALRSLFMALAVGALTLQVRSSGQRQNDPATTRFRTAVNYVRVDVYASLRGSPVLDLTRDDFEVRENGVAQVIDTFERIDIPSNGQAPRARQPNTVAESRDLVQTSRARVFVIFLDVPHITGDTARSIGPRLATAVNGLVGPDDLVALMTPDMKATDVAFGRGADIVARILTSGQWGERGRDAVTPGDRLYQVCYPGLGPNPGCGDDDRGVADEMIARRQERDTLAALDDLMLYLRTARDERKAVLVVSDGWRLYRANRALERRLNCQSGMPQTGVDPLTGRVTSQRGVGTRDVDLTRCETDRMALAALDNDRTFRSMLNRANRANVSFYSLDPRGVVVFDTPIDQVRTGLSVPGNPTIPSVITDAARLSTRQSSLRDLATATDGLAILNTNDVESGLRRVSADLSSYYLLGYYSTGKLDGRFHRISVSVKRKDVDVRARAGFEAAKESDVETAATPVVAKPDLVGAQIAMAMADLAAVTRESPLAVSASSGWVTPSNAQWWVSGELAGAEMWRAGAEISAILSNSSGDAVATGRASLAAGIRSFRLTLRGGALEAGQYRVAVRAQPKEPGARSELVEAPAPLLETPRAYGAVIARRGTSTGRSEIPAVAGRFRRTDTIRIDVAEIENAVPSARVLDRTGHPVNIPLKAEHMQDGDGMRWASVQLALAPLAPADYLIELTQTPSAGSTAVPQTLVAFRIVP